MFVASACKKDILDPDAGSDFSPIVKTNPALLTARPLNIMSEYEIKNKIPFSGHILAKMGSKPVGGVLHIGWEAISIVGEVLWEAFDYNKTECNFGDVFNQLSEIENQLDSIDKHIKHNADLFKIEMNQLESFLQSTQLNVQMVYVDNAMSEHINTGLMHKVKLVKEYKENPNDATKKRLDDMLNLLKDEAAKIVNEQAIAGTMQDAIMQMKSVICPAEDVGITCLKSYVKTIIPKCQGQVKDSISAMNAYLLLEGYFMKVVISQLQAAIVYTNYCNVYDTQGYLSSDFWYGYVTKVIPQEVDIFLEAVDYLSVNLSDYRTEKQYLHDMQYSDYGIAPDNMFFNVYARSQFLANLLYAVSLKSYSTINGHILVPNKYTTDGSGSTKPNPLSVMIGSEKVNSSGTSLASQIPYTYWQDECSYPDNKWNSYRFSSDTSHKDWQCTPLTIEILANDSITPWFHLAESIKGSITPLYYNPNHPQQTSTTPNDSCYFQFGYFAASWYWGYLKLVNNTGILIGPKASSNSSFFDVNHYDDRKANAFPPDYKRFTVPNAYNYDKSNGLVAYPSASFSFRGGHMNSNTTLGGFFVFWGTSENVCIIDSRNCGDVRPEITSPKETVANAKINQNTVEAWGCYSGFINGWSGKSPNLIISLGTHSHYKKDVGNVVYLYQVGDILYNDYKDFASPYILQSAFARTTLEVDEFYDPGFQYFYTTTIKNANVKGEISIDFHEQFIYTGLYDLED
jgi:hypothetical protein